MTITDNIVQTVSINDDFGVTAFHENLLQFFNTLFYVNRSNFISRDHAFANFYGFKLQGIVEYFFV